MQVAQKIINFEDKEVITDEAFRTRFHTLPNIIVDWLPMSFNWNMADVLDFGCGEGITALGFALRKSCHQVTGVDIMPDPERCSDRALACLGLACLPDNLHLHRVLPGTLHDSSARFDLVYSWSVFEHVDQRVFPSTIGMLAKSLKPEGYLFVQIAPLYYSAEGSHLFHKIPEPWAHLTDQQSVYYEKLERVCENDEELDALWSTYRTLNQIIAPELEEAFAAAGLRIIRRHITEHPAEPCNALLRRFHGHVLRTDQIVLLAQLC